MIIATSFVPQGIVMATSVVDTIYETVADTDGSPEVCAHRCAGLKHVMAIGSRGAIAWKPLTQSRIDTAPEQLIKRVAIFDDPIDVVASKIADAIADGCVRMMAHLAGYDDRGEQHIYEIMGENIWRVNVDEEGNTFSHCAITERHPLMSRILRPAQMLNGDEWMEIPEIDLRFDLQFLDKAIDTCRMLVHTGTWLAMPLDARHDNPSPVEMAIITPDDIRLTTM